MATSSSVTLPVPIFKLNARCGPDTKYLIYDVDHVTFLRREHNICGVLAGNLPQAPQQNVFSGLPLELMPEEAHLLVAQEVAYIVDDTLEHRRNFVANGLSGEERKAYQAALAKQGQGAAREASKRSDDRRIAALEKKKAKNMENWNDIPDDMFTPGPRRGKKPTAEATPTADTPDDESLFGPAVAASSRAPMSSAASDVGSAILVEPFAVTPTTSYPPLTGARPIESDRPAVPVSYPLYKHMHDEGYFLAPGLRFGCQYMAYPGDPLRFHSHFLCNGMQWDEEFDLLDIVGGGRLGTGVKKGFLIGGTEHKKPEKDADDAGTDVVRAFCIEWGGM